MFRPVARFAFAVLLVTSLVACSRAKPVTSSAPVAPAATGGAQPPAAAGASASDFTGTVAETMNSGGYTYARLQAAGKDDVWIAGNEFPAKAGDRLTVALEMPMQNFESKTLKRSFPLIYFVSSVARGGQTAGGAPAAPGAGGMPMATSHGPATAPVKVEPVAPAAGGLSIAELWAKRTALAGTQVILRGKVVKVNTAILDHNWVHIQDGSGSGTDGTNDMTVTTDADVKVGDIVTVTGVLAVDKDFGAGYAYKAIVENARLTSK